MSRQRQFSWACAVQGAARGRPRRGKRGFGRFLQCTSGGAVRTTSPPPSPRSSVSVQQGRHGSGQSIGLLSRLSSRLSLALSRRGDSTLSRAGASFSRQRQALAGCGRAPQGAHHHGRLQAPQQQAPPGSGRAPQGAHVPSTQQAPQQQRSGFRGSAGGAVQRPASRPRELQETDPEALAAGSGSEASSPAGSVGSVVGHAMFVGGASPWDATPQAAPASSFGVAGPHSQRHAAPCRYSRGPL